METLNSKPNTLRKTHIIPCQLPDGAWALTVASTITGVITTTDFRGELIKQELCTTAITMYLEGALRMYDMVVPEWKREQGGEIAIQRAKEYTGDWVALAVWHLVQTGKIIHPTRIKEKERREAWDHILYAILFKKYMKNKRVKQRRNKIGKGSKKSKNGKHQKETKERGCS